MVGGKGRGRLGLAGLALIALGAATRARGEGMGAPAISGSPGDSLSLATALEWTFQRHPDLRVARTAVSVARADSVYAGSPSFNPELEIGGSRGGESLGDGTDGSFEVGLSQELELWGQRAARRSVATSRSRATGAELLARRQAIESDVRAHFAWALHLAARLATLEELTELDRSVVRSAEARVRDGSITPLTGRMTELDFLRLEGERLHTRADHRQALAALGLAMGVDLPESVRLAGALAADTLAAPEDSVVALALRSRRERDALAFELDARRAELHLAEREARPNPTVGAGLAFERSAIEAGEFSGDPAIVSGIHGVSSSDRMWRARVSLPLPIRQRNQAARGRAAAEIERGQASIDRFETATRLATRASVRRFEDATALYRLYVGRATRVRQDLVLVREAYADGRISLDSYLTQKGRLVDTLLQGLEAADGYWQSRAELEAVVGADLDRINAGASR